MPRIQMSTMLVGQGTMMDTSIGSFRLPPASLSTFDVISVILWVPIYDKFIVPIARKFTGKERGFSELQRMGIGLFYFSLLHVSSCCFIVIAGTRCSNNKKFCILFHFYVYR
jgi:peptide/histidine transporter 3/4